MQQNSSYLTFSLNNRLHGINSDYVEEVLPLPELILLPETDCNIVGIFDLRGEPLPVLDLNNKLGYPKTDYHLSDSLIIVRCSQLRLGIIINGFSDIRTINSQEIVRTINTQVNGNLESLINNSSEIIFGRAIGEDEVWILNDLENWIEVLQIKNILTSLIHQEDAKHDDFLFNDLNGFRAASDQQITFCPTATPEEKAVFRNRAESLKASTQESELTELQPIVIFALGDRLWGVDSGHVREFVDIKKITPVPCCPIHIIGNTNLRGEILTIVDIRKSLDIPILEISAPCKVIVVKIEDMVVGIIVDSIRDAMFLVNLQDVIPTAIALPDVENDYLEGAIPYEVNNQQLIGIVNLPKLLLQGGFMIDELV